MLSPFAASNPNSGEDQLHPQPQQDLYTQQLGCPSKLSFNLQSGAYPALSSRASKLFNSDLSRYGNASFHGVSQPFGHSESLHANNNLPNSKMLNYGSYTPSNTLSSTDLRFSGYILGSTSEINRSNHSYNGPSSACAVTACDSSTNHFKMLGTSDTQSQPTQYAGGRLSAAGASGLSVSSTPYHECSSFGTMSMARYDPCSSYSSLLNKANLLFDNNLESMTVEWSIEEHECRRRLVQFWRRHENNSISCTFKAVSAADRVPNSTVVSCIFWEKKQDFFITSVDCIHLLESLIAVRFTVEEKNRIRRNLEGFRPLTVSKCKAESADFFKLIMSFPNPKPRNIEKDVKVFPWRILPLALKKIIGKYTASYSNPSGASLDALTATRASSSSQLEGVPLSAPAGGMMAFSPNVSCGLTSTSAITTVMAAATSNSADFSTRGNSFGTTFAAANAQAPMPSTASGPASKPSTTTSLEAILEAQGARNKAKTGPESCDISSTHIACPQSDTGMCLNLDFGMGIDGNSLDTVETSASIVSPTSLSSNPLLGFGQLVSSAAHEKSVNSFTPLLLQNQPQHQNQNCSSTFKQEDNQQLYLAGMAFNPSLQLSTSASVAQHDRTAANFANGHIFEQLVGYGIPSLDCGLQMADTKNSHGINSHISSSQSQLQPQLQLAVRGSSTKRSTPYMPYNIDRAQRNKPGSASSDCGFKTMVQNDLLSRVSTSLSSTCENLSMRAVSPSIPLTMQQHATSSAAEAASFNSFLDLDAAAGPSTTPTTLLHSMLTSTEPPSVDSYTSLATSTEEFISSKAASVPFHDMLGKAFYNPSQPHVQNIGSNLQAHEINNANIPDLPIDSAIASDDYTFLADLIRVSAGYTTANHTSTSPNNGTAYSTSTEIKDSESSTATTDADTCSDHESTKNTSVSVGGLVEQIFSPHTALAKPTPQYTTGLRADQTSSNGDTPAHGLESSLLFNTVLFGDAKPSHGF